MNVYKKILLIFRLFLHSDFIILVNFTQFSLWRSFNQTIYLIHLPKLNAVLEQCVLSHRFLEQCSKFYGTVNRPAASKHTTVAYNDFLSSPEHPTKLIRFRSE